MGWAQVGGSFGLGRAHSHVYYGQLGDPGCGESLIVCLGNGGDLTACLFIILQVSWGLFTQQLGRDPKERARACKAFLRPRLGFHSRFYWSKRITRPDQIQGIGKLTPLLEGRCCKVTLQKVWIQDGGGGESTTSFCC